MLDLHYEALVGFAQQSRATMLQFTRSRFGSISRRKIGDKLLGIGVERLRNRDREPNILNHPDPFIYICFDHVVGMIAKLCAKAAQEPLLQG